VEYLGRAAFVPRGGTGEGYTKAAPLTRRRAPPARRVPLQYWQPFSFSISRNRPARG